MKRQDTSLSIEGLVAKKIREARLRQGFTLQKFSKLTEISVPMLSKIETAKVSSPISTYAKIAKGLEIPLGEFFSEEKTISLSFVKRQERRQYTQFAGYLGESIAFKKPHKKMEPFVLSYSPKKALPSPYQHDNEELIFVIEGRLEFQYDGSQYILNPGDCVYFDANKKHSARALKPSWWMPKDRILSVG